MYTPGDWLLQGVSWEKFLSVVPQARGLEGLYQECQTALASDPRWQRLQAARAAVPSGMATSRERGRRRDAMAAVDEQHYALLDALRTEPDSLVARLEAACRAARQADIDSAAQAAREREEAKLRGYHGDPGAVESPDGMGWR